MSTNDFITAEACDSSAGFAVDQGTATLAIGSTFLEGTGALEITSGSSPQIIEVGANVTAFNIKQRNYIKWINYSKGKAAQFLTDAANALRLRCYFGGTNPASTPYAEWNQGGNLTIPFGWSTIVASGTTADTLGNGHNGTTDYDLTVQRTSLILDQANNNSGGNDPPFITDYWHHGTRIEMTGGSLGTPLDETDILAYDAANNLGVVLQDRSQKGLITRCGIWAGDGTTAGFLAFEGLGILNQQLSDEVEQVWRVRGNSGMRFGRLTVGADSTYAEDGCQLDCPALRNPDFLVDDGADFQAYATRFFGWGKLEVGEVGGSAGNRVMRLCDIDACESFNRNQVGSYTEIELHDAAHRTQQHAGECYASPTASSALIHNNDEGVHYREDVTDENQIFDDQTTIDFRVLTNKRATLRSSEFDATKTAEQTT